MLKQRGCTENAKLHTFDLAGPLIWTGTKGSGEQNQESGQIDKHCCVEHTAFFQLTDLKHEGNHKGEA